MKELHVDMTEGSSSSGRISLQLPDGKVRDGALVDEVDRYLAPASVRFAGALSWNVLSRGSSIEVTFAEFRAECRRSFAWRDLVLRCATTLAAVRNEDARSPIHDELLRWALCDDWPAAIVDWPALVDRWQTLDRAAIVASEQAALSVLADALAEPWDGAPRRLRDGFAEARFARLLMLAADVFDATPLEPASAGGGDDTYISEPLLGVGRLRESDDPLPALVRSHELYVELLPRWLPAAPDLFEAIKGVPLWLWLCDASLIVNTCFQALKPGTGHCPLLDFRSGEPTAERMRLRRVAESMALDARGFAEELGRVRSKDVAPGLAFEPLRIHPLLRDEENLWVILHTDFLLTAMEDGPWYVIADALRGRSPSEAGEFRTNFGEVFQAYVGRTLERCSAAVGDAAVARIPESQRLRSDFAWRIGPDLVLVEAKRASVASNVLMGAAGLPQAIDRMAQKACTQLLTTQADLRALLPELAPQLRVGMGWLPRRTFALVVHHRPLFMWFASGGTVLNRMNRRASWHQAFAALPAFVDIAELERFEPAAEHVAGWLDALASDHPIAYAGVHSYLLDAGYDGPRCSERVVERGRSLLAARATGLES